MKGRVVIWYLAFLIMGLPGCQNDSDNSQDAETVDQEERASAENGTTDWLYILTGRLDTVGTGQLLLRPEGSVTAFSDRPERKVKVLSYPAFLRSNWGHGGSFVQDPPNASLIEMGMEAPESAVITLTGMISSDDGRILVEYELLEGELPASGFYGALVIDSSPTMVNPQITD